MDLVFRALNDAHRRRMLDLLHASSGLTTSQIESSFEDIGRFGVMKHLKLLEEASLVTSRKVGRFRYHYLNPVPLQEVAERWISRFTAPWAQHLHQLKTRMETAMTTRPKHVFVTVIKTTPEKLWAALTDGNITPAYYYGGRFEGQLTPGSAYRYVGPEGGNFVSGTILEADAPHRLVASFKGEWMPGMENDAPTRITYEILPQGECCRLTLIHEDFEGETATYLATGGGWPGILSGLKTLLETGQPLNYNPMAA